MTDATTSISGWRARFELSEQEWDRVALAAVVLAAALRVVWVVVVHPPLRYVYSDMRGYVLRAQGLASGSPLSPDDSFFPPGTQLILAIPLRFFGLVGGLWASAFLWCLLSITTVYMAWRLVRGILSPAAGAITAIFCAMWPLFITYSGYFTSETPALAFLIAALWAGLAATRSGGRRAVVLAVLSGVLGGAASAVRPQLLVNVVLLVAFVLLIGPRRVMLVSCLLAGLAAVTGAIIIHNSIASGQVTGLARNGGLNFWFGHCNARSVSVLNAQDVKVGEIRHPVPSQAGRPGDYVFKNRELWDESFFVGLGEECIAKDGLGHVVRLGRNVLDMTATTMPWPQSGEEGWSKDVVQVSNVAYSVLLPWIVIESVSLVRRRGRTEGRGELFLIANFACAAVVAVFVLGDPRVRTVYDVFGLALLSALLADRLRLDAPRESASVP